MVYFPFIHIPGHIKVSFAKILFDPHNDKTCSYAYANFTYADIVCMDYKYAVFSEHAQFTV